MKMIYITKWTPLHVYLIICRTGFTQNVAINKTQLLRRNVYSTHRYRLTKEIGFSRIFAAHVIIELRDDDCG